MRDPRYTTLFHNLAIWRRAALLLIACGILGAIASSEAIHAALLDVLGAVEQAIERRPALGALAFVALSAVSAMFTFLSVAIIVPAAVFTWGAPLTALQLWLGWMLGGVFTYCVGRWLGRAVVHWLTASETLERLERRMQRDAPFWLVLMLQIALPSEITGYVLGMLRYRPASYLLALGLAELPYTLATVYLGESFVAGHGAQIVLIGLLAAGMSVAALYYVRRVLGGAPREAH